MPNVTYAQFELFASGSINGILQNTWPFLDQCTMLSTVFGPSIALIAIFQTAIPKTCQECFYTLEGRNEGMILSHSE